MSQKTLNGLRKARELLAGGWCQGTLARDANGDAAAKGMDDPVSYCLNGALSYAWDDLFFDLEAARDAIVRAGRMIGHDIMVDLDEHGRKQAAAAKSPMLATRWAMEDWNDMANRTQEEVLAVVDKAIEIEEKETV